MTSQNNFAIQLDGSVHPSKVDVSWWVLCHASLPKMLIVLKLLVL